MMRGSFVTARGLIHGAPAYLNLPSGTPVLYFYVQVKNSSNWLATLRAVAYGEQAQDLARELSDGLSVFVEGRFQTRLHHDRLITEVVACQVTAVDLQGAIQLGSYGAHATLLGRVVDGPTVEQFERFGGVRFGVECPNPDGRGSPSRVVAANYGYLAEQYQVTLCPGQIVLLHGEVRTIRLPALAGENGPLLEVRVVTEDVEVLGHDSY